MPAMSINDINGTSYSLQPKGVLDKIESNSPKTTRCFSPHFPKKKLAIGITLSSLKLHGGKGSNLNVFQQIQITPLKISMEHNSLEVWKIIFLSKWMICRFHVNLPGCIHLKKQFGSPFSAQKIIPIQKKHF